MAEVKLRDVSAGMVRHGKLRRSSSVRNGILGSLTIVLAMALSAVAVLAYAVLGLFTSIDTVELGNQGPQASAVSAADVNLDGELNIMIVGSDSRAGQFIQDGNEGELNDVNLLLHVSADHKQATVISFPRDLMLPIPSCPGPDGEENYYSAMSEQQLNSAMQYGGLPCVVRTIEELTGMDIPYAGLVTFDGVVAISNALGGVNVCLSAPIVDPKTDLDLPAGNVTLQGQQALQFLRTRYGVGDGGDTSRISNQQVFMSALARQLKSEKTLSDPVRVYALAKAGVENMQLSSSMANVKFMQALASTVKNIDLDKINFVQYPTFSHPYQSGRLTPDYQSAKVLFEVLRSGQAFDVASLGKGVGDASGAAPAEGTPAAETPAAEAPAEEAPAAGEAETPAADGKVTLPSNITGQSASKETCSQGRTVY